MATILMNRSGDKIARLTDPALRHGHQFLGEEGVARGLGNVWTFATAAAGFADARAFVVTGELLELEG